MKDLYNLPPDLPVPIDDGACDHLPGLLVPSIKIKTTSDTWVELKEIARNPSVIFFYPRTGEPDKPTPPGWDLIPGARGCTPQSCSFRDFYAEFKTAGYEVFGASSQTTDYQKEFVARNHIPFEILSDSEFKLTEALKLPTFTYNGMRLIKRMALVLNDGKVQKVFYPVFPPNENAATVLAWINTAKIKA